MTPVLLRRSINNFHRFVFGPHNTTMVGQLGLIVNKHKVKSVAGRPEGFFSGIRSWKSRPRGSPFSAFGPGGGTGRVAAAARSSRWRSHVDCRRRFRYRRHYQGSASREPTRQQQRHTPDKTGVSSGPMTTLPNKARQSRAPCATTRPSRKRWNGMERAIVAPKKSRINYSTIRPFDHAT